jgi:hypothetical protein
VTSKETVVVADYGISSKVKTNVLPYYACLRSFLKTLKGLWLFLTIMYIIQIKVNIIIIPHLVFN